MSEIEIRVVKTKKEMDAFARLNYELYKDNEYAVPDMLEDMRDKFDPKKNPAYEFCESELFLAYRDGRVVGRVAALINHKANERWQCRDVRFGWIDFIDDPQVSRALLDAVADWGRQHQMTHIVGPLGFTDMDKEGMLTEGFDQLSTMDSIYNFPYYNDHMRQHGFEKETGWLEYKVYVPVGEHTAQQDKFFRVAEMTQRRYGFKVRKFKSVKEIKQSGYIDKIFHIVNESYKELYGYSEMTKRQIDMYADNYLQFLDMRLVTVIETAEGEPIGIGICMPSMSRAIQKAKAKMLPFGWWHMLKALKFKHSEVLDMLLVGVLPEYQNKGANALLFADLIPIAKKMGFKWAETHHILEDNGKSQSQWVYLDTEVHKRRVAYKRALD